MRAALAALALIAAPIVGAAAAPLGVTANYFNAATGLSGVDTKTSDGPAASSSVGFSSASGGASATASGDLTTAKLRASATSSVAFEVLPFTGTVIRDNTNTFASVALSDTFSIVGSYTGVQSATLLVAVDGTLISGPSALAFNGASAFASFQLVLEGGLTARVDEIAQFQDRCNCLPQVLPDYLRVGEGFWTATFSIPLLFSDLANTFTLSSSLLAEATLGGQALFGNTADLTLLLPAGLSVASASGLLFSADTAEGPTSVPEPASAAIFAFGLLGLGAARHRTCRNA